MQRMAITWPADIVFCRDKRGYRRGAPAQDAYRGPSLIPGGPLTIAKAEEGLYVTIRFGDRGSATMVP